MLQDKQAKEEEKQKERRWACLHRLKKKGVAFVASAGVERGLAGLSRSTRRDITWPINTSCTIPGGTASILGVMVMPISLRTLVESGWCSVRYGLPQALPEASSGACPSQWEMTGHKTKKS